MQLGAYEILRFQDDIANLGMSFRILLGDFAANHHLNHIVQAELLVILGAHGMTVSQNGDTVDDMLKFIQSVRDIDVETPLSRECGSS